MPKSSDVRATVLMAFSSLLASLVSLDASFLTNHHHYFRWCQVLFANGVVGSALCFGLWLLHRSRKQKYPLLGSRVNRPWLVLRGIFGAMANACAWIAIRYLPLGDANTIMFTSPSFTGLLAFVILGQEWQLRDTLLTATCLVGVVLVVRPNFIFHSASADAEGKGRWLGVGA